MLLGRRCELHRNAIAPPPVNSASETPRIRTLMRSSHSNCLMASNNTDAYLPERYRQEIATVNVSPGRRGVLRTLALTAATSVIGLASARAEPAAAAAESALTPRGATYLDPLH